MKGLTVLFLAACSLPLQVSLAQDDAEIIKPGWKRPSMWRKPSHHSDDDGAVPAAECRCPAPPVCELPTPAPETEKPVVQRPPDEDCALGFAFYKKFLGRLFDERRLEKDHDQDGFLVRNAQLRITRHQLESLKEAKTAREIDGIISSVVEQSTESTFNAVRESICWGVVELVALLSSNSYVLYLFIATFGLLAIYWLVRVLARIMHVHPLIVFVLMVLLVSYAVSYQDCNRRLEAEAMAKFSFSGDSNPCGKSPGAEPSGWFARLWGNSHEAKCQEYLKQTLTSKSTICDPSTVAVEMVAKLQLHYFEIFIHKLLGVFKSSTANTGWFGGILITAFICVIVYTVVTNCVKYGMYGSANFFAALVTSPRRGLNHQQREALAAGPVPPTPITLNINLDPLGRLAALADTNRIEEIADLGEPTATRAITDERGAGDAPEPCPAAPVDKGTGEGRRLLLLDEAAAGGAKEGEKEPAGDGGAARDTSDNQRAAETIEL